MLSAAVLTVLGAARLLIGDSGVEREARAALAGGRPLPNGETGGKRVLFAGETLSGAKRRVRAGLSSPGWIAFDLLEGPPSTSGTITGVHLMHSGSSAIETFARWIEARRGRATATPLRIVLRPVPGGVEAKLSPFRLRF